MSSMTNTNHTSRVPWDLVPGREGDSFKFRKWRDYREELSFHIRLLKFHAECKKQKKRQNDFIFLHPDFLFHWAQNCPKKISHNIKLTDNSSKITILRKTGKLDTVKPRYTAPAFNIIPPIKHANFGPKKYFHSYFYIGNKENLDIRHNFDQSLEKR